MIIDRKEINLNNYNGYLEINNDVIINISGNVKINEIINNNNLNITINLSDESNLEYNRFGVINNDTNIIINQKNNSTLCFTESFIANNQTKLTITNNIMGNDNKSDIIIRVTEANNSKVIVDATAIVDKETTNNELKEDLRGIEENNGNITIIPNLVVASSEVIANHNTTIGNYRSDNIHYLTSKGIDKNTAKKILRDAFILGEFKDSDFKEKIKEIINK